ncbi:uncharacterized protein LOC111023967 [Momordica charantia]|uniref:Uncharacterized protein LOC111023967 n=1 Tax=Momordica charantia TaxID=3673 RepID=A0A6J1DSR0_MOMCH|nr:uncharacterized protein LOC111023967 [Momordica charantia]
MEETYNKMMWVNRIRSQSYVPGGVDDLLDDGDDQDLPFHPDDYEPIADNGVSTTKEGKTLREYVSRFQKEQLKVAHCFDDSTMCYFLTSLANETLTVQLSEEAPSTFADVLQKAKKVIDGQELLKPKLGRTDKRSDQKKSGNQEKGKSDSKLEKLLKRPNKLRGDSERCNKDMYCHFHLDHGLLELKRQIEDLIQDGYFKKYVGKPGSSSTEKKEEKKHSRTPPRRDDRPAIINIIFGGPSEGTFGNKRKKLVREGRREVCTVQEQKPTCHIYFSASDLEGVHVPHNDALVISPLINHVQVRRVLMDGGVLANILSFTTYLVLGWTRSQQKKSPTPLVRFAGESVTHEGCIDLLITIGQGDTQVT